MNDIAKYGGIKFEPYFADTFTETMDKFYDGKLDAIIVTDSFPGELINFIVYNFYNLHFISLDKINGDKVDSQYYDKTNIDLNHLPANYLPQVRYDIPKYRKQTLFSNIPPYYGGNVKDKYVFFNSSFMTLRFNNLVICNKNIEPEIVYLFTKQMFEFKHLIQKPYNAFSLINIPMNAGSKKYYYEKGYMSNNSHTNCIYLYGKEKCDEKTLHTNKLDYSLYYNNLG